MPVEFEIRQSSRGPLMDMELLQGAEVLFSEGLPSINDGSIFSFAWSGAIGEEGSTKAVRGFIKSTKI